MPMPTDARVRVVTAYDAAADAYDLPANSFWERFGTRTVERLDLQPGMRILDVCCGSGGSALPAAERVGPRGEVLGIDLAENLLELARAKARARGLAQAEFRHGDMLALETSRARFDAVVCVFGIFFVPQMETGVGALWRHVRPGGCLAVTTWGPRVFEPLNSVFWQAVGERRPELQRSFNPWDKITEPAALRALLERGGVDGELAIAAESGQHPLRSPADGWALVRGSGYRGTLDQLTPSDQAHVQHRCEEFLAARDVGAVEASVVYAVARRPR